MKRFIYLYSWAVVSSVRSFGLDMLLAPRGLCVISPPAQCFMNVVVNDGRSVFRVASGYWRVAMGIVRNLMIPISLNGFGGFAFPLMTPSARNN